MLESFQLAAIVRRAAHTRLLRIPLHQALQDRLAATWQEQFDAFFDGTQEIDFNPGYQPEEHETFCLDDFVLPAWLTDEDSEAAANLDPLQNNDGALADVRGLVAFACDDQGEEVMLFQNFSRAHVIRPGHFLLMRNNTYETSEHSGLTLDQKLSAVYLPVDGKLLFQNFRTVNTFLPLADLYKEASEQDIREVLAHDRLSAENPDAMAKSANQWFRKRFAMLRDSGVLDQYSAVQIKNRANGYDVEVHIEQGKIVFPADKPAAKKLLQFLNEEIFKGAITATLYETNSKRAAD
ncbi:MAG: hypothetical protein ABIU96_13890 [Rhodanobacter sp.]